MPKQFISVKPSSNIIKWRDIFSYILVFITIYLGSSYMAVVTGRIPGIVRITVVLGFAFITLLLFKHSLDKYSMFCFLILTTVSLVCFLLNQDELYNFSILFLGGILSGYLISEALSFECFAKKYVNIIALLSLISIIIFLLSCFMPKLLSVFPTVGYKFAYEIKSALGFAWVQNARIPQNYGIFWEPGAYQTFLSFALIIDLFYFKNNFSQKNILIMIALLTTLSTTGFFCFLVILLSYRINIASTSNHFTKKDKWVIFIIVFAIILLFAFSNFNELLFSKMSGLFDEDKVLSHSTQTRLDAIRYPFLSFLESPLIGIGYKNFLTLNAVQCNNNATFTIINWFALYGFFFGSIITVGYFRIEKYFSVPQKTKFLVFIVLFLMVISESYYTNPFIFLMVFYGYKRGDMRCTRC